MTKTNKSFLQRAGDLIAATLGRSASFQQREEALRERLSELAEEKQSVMSAYDPDRGGLDRVAIQRIDAEVSEVDTELAALGYSNQSRPERETAEKVAMLESVRAEANEVLAKKAAEAAGIREEITAAKSAYLEALRKHNAVFVESGYITGDYKDAIGKLAVSVGKEITRLRDEYHALDRRLSNEASSASGRRHNQSELDRLQDEKDSTMRRILALEAQAAPINNPVKAVADFSLSGAGNPLLVSELEAKRASRGEGGGV